MSVWGAKRDSPLASPRQCIGYYRSARDALRFTPDFDQQRRNTRLDRLKYAIPCSLARPDQPMQRNAKISTGLYQLSVPGRDRRRSGLRAFREPSVNGNADAICFSSQIGGEPGINRAEGGSELSPLTEAGCSIIISPKRRSNVTAQLPNAVTHKQLLALRCNINFSVRRYS